MNRVKLRCLQVITLCFSLVAGTVFSETAYDKREVGEFDSNGELVLHHHVLKKEFQNGTLVDQFKTITLEGKLYLERSGIDKSGNHIKETAPLKYDEKADLLGEPAYLEPNSIFAVTGCSHYRCGCSEFLSDAILAMTEEIDAELTFSHIEKNCACSVNKTVVRVESRDSSEPDIKVDWDDKTDIAYRVFTTDPGEGIEPYALRLCESDSEHNKLKLDDWLD